MAYVCDCQTIERAPAHAPPAVESLSQRVGDAFRRGLAIFAAWADQPDERAVRRLVASSGGRLTDSLERELMRRATIQDWSLPR